MDAKKRKIVSLLDQIIEKSAEKDKAEKNFIKHSMGINGLGLGESWMTFHLKNLKELIVDMD